MLQNIFVGLILLLVCVIIITCALWCVSLAFDIMYICNRCKRKRNIIKRRNK